MIKYNGAQVSPQELEEVIVKHPNVVDVGVVGTDMADGNELPTAFVVLTAGSQDDVLEEIIRFTADQVSPYKRLRGGVYRKQSIPKNNMGKIQHHILRKEANEIYRTLQRRSRSKI